MVTATNSKWAMMAPGSAISRIHIRRERGCGWDDTADGQAIRESPRAGALRFPTRIPVAKAVIAMTK
jgi:hypothetical protein